MISMFLPSGTNAFTSADIAVGCGRASAERERERERERCTYARSLVY
jgi:hypothetical protein